ncbi:MAG: hypothetical protein WD491_05170 [Balneolales bacterium]
MMNFKGTELLATSGISTVQSDSSFSIIIESNDEQYSQQGESNFMKTPSSYSIHMNGDNIRCTLHMLNFKSVPGPGTYKVEDVDDVRTAAVCLLENREPRERLASVSGTFSITEIDNDGIKGHIEMVLKGAITNEKYNLSGKVESVNVPMHLEY